MMRKVLGMVGGNVACVDASGIALDTIKGGYVGGVPAAAQGRAVYCWNVDEYQDIEFCRDIGVAWLATHHPGRTKAWLQNARAEGLDGGRPPATGGGSG